MYPDVLQPSFYPLCTFWWTRWPTQKLCRFPMLEGFPSRWPAVSSTSTSRRMTTGDEGLVMNTQPRRTRCGAVRFGAAFKRAAPCPHNTTETTTSAQRCDGYEEDAMSTTVLRARRKIFSLLFVVDCTDDHKHAGVLPIGKTTAGRPLLAKSDDQKQGELKQKIFRSDSQALLCGSDSTAKAFGDMTKPGFIDHRFPGN